MADSLKFWITYFVLVLVILVVGWKQPLKYRFMSKQEIAEYEAGPSTPTPKAATPWMYDPKRSTKLDRGAYNTRRTLNERRTSFMIER